jgi:methyltransferase
VTPAVLLLAFVTAELARRNTAALLAKGAFEAAPGHYPLIVLLHAVWLLGLWLIGWANPLSRIWLVIFLGLQVFRAWVLLTLGRRWTTRIVVLPGAPLVKNGPYRLLSHPNYVVVIFEIAVLPLCFGLLCYALVFSAANAVIVAIRIRAENAALIGLRDPANG